MRLVERLVYSRRRPVFGRIAKEVLALYGIEIPAMVDVGDNLRILHRGFGIVIHPATVIGNRVTIFHGVTIGRSEPWQPDDLRPCAHVGDDAVLCPGAVLVSAESPMLIGRGTIVGANSVLTTSTGEWEVWAGAPARRIGTRTDAAAGA